MNRRNLILSTVASLALGLLGNSAWAQAQNFPNKPVKLVVPFPAGSSPDITARMVADKLSQAWGQPVLIDNKAGAAGAIGAELVKQSPADGYTILFAVTSILAINPHVLPNLRYQPLIDFTAVAEVATIPYVLVAPVGAPFNTLAELAEVAKRKPGGLDYASAGVGSQLQVTIEMWSKQMGIKLNHIPYVGSAYNDLMGGSISLLLDPATTAIPMVKSSKLKAIAVSTPQRLPALPNVPAASEFMPGMVSTAWHGMFAPKATPPDIVNKFNTEMQRVLALPDVKAKLLDLGLIPVLGSAADFNAKLANEYAMWGRAVRDLNIKLE